MTRAILYYGNVQTADLGEVRTVQGFDADDANRVAANAPVAVKLDFAFVAKRDYVFGGYFRNSDGDCILIE